MTKKEIAAKLRQALALMNDNGAHWIKGEYEETLEWDDDKDEPAEVAYCSLGAIRHVTDTPVFDSSPESDALAFALADVLPALNKTRADQLPEGIAYDRIVNWNDDDDRTWEEVAAKFNEAADLLENSPDMS